MKSAILQTLRTLVFFLPVYLIVSYLMGTTLTLPRVLITVGVFSVVLTLINLYQSKAR